MSFEKFKDSHCGGHHGYQNGTILAIQVLAQSDLWFGSRYGFKNFKIAAVVALLDIGTERF